MGIGTSGRRRSLVTVALVTTLVLAGLSDVPPAGAGSSTLVPFGSVWAFDDSGSDLGTGWREPGHDDGGWSSGPGQLGYGDGDEATVVSFGGDGSDKHITTYFRRTFEVGDPGSVSALEVRLRRDDGAVVYLNGTEVLRDNLPGGVITAGTVATTWQISETVPVTASVPAGLLVAGTNTVAVEVHQAWRTSSDLTFDLELAGTITGPTTTVPTTTTTVPTTTVPTTTVPTTTVPTTTIAPPPAGSSTLVPFGSVWAFDDSGSDLGTGWREPGHDDGGWSSGPGQLGYGDGDEATVVSFGGDGSDKHITTYFRRTFEVGDPGSVSALEVRLRRDDGAVVYLNGTEVLRDNLPGGVITAGTVATTWQISETVPVTASVPAGLLVAGTNTVAVEVHQAWRTSSDLTFDLELAGTITGPTTTTTPSTTVPTTTTPEPPGGDAATLLAVGDIARCGGGHPAVASVLADQSGTFAPLGDIAYPDGSAQEFAQCYDPWFGEALDRTRPTPGNHEYNTPGATGYYGYFGARAGDPTAGWYSYDLGDWHVVALNSECFEVGGCGPGSPMYLWLQADLAAAGTPCVAAYWHRARRSSEAGYVGPAYLDPLLGLLEEHGVDVLLAGHAHTYERFARLDTAGNPSPTGIRHFVVGTGGHSLRAFGPAVGGSQARSNTAPGLLRLDLGANGYSWRFLAAGGSAFADQGSDTCTPSAPASPAGLLFSDVPPWIDDAVEWITDPGRQPPFATGYPDLTYRPALEVSRGQVARLLHRIAGAPPVDDLRPHGLTDVPAWTDDGVRWLLARGMATGYGDGTFRADQPITRAQFARMVHRSVGAPEAGPGPRFVDVPPWAATAVAWITGPAPGGPIATGYGDGTYRPDQPITRAQMTSMLYRQSLG